MESNRKSSVFPVLFAFFVMGFCDIVGVSTSYVKADFNLSETMAGFIPSMVFIWFLFLSVPAAMMMNKFGRKTMVQVSNIITLVAMLIPFFSYNFVSCMIAFVMLGIGNTILQVALNPLLTNVVSGNNLTSSINTGQVIKAVSSFLNPERAALSVSLFVSWKSLFLTYAMVTFISCLWLAITPITETAPSTKSLSLGNAFALLKNPVILILFLGIFFVVGVDVGINTVSPKLLIERCGWMVDKAGYGSSVYFVCRTVGAMLGAFLLTQIDDIKYFKISIFGAAAVMVALFFAPNALSILCCVGLIGFLCSSIFSIIISAALKSVPEKANYISGFMITGIVGAAVIPPLLGLLADTLGSQIGSLIVISGCIVYLIFCCLWLAYNVQPSRRREQDGF